MGRENPSVCVVTHPLGTVGDTHTTDLVRIVDAITAVNVIAPAVPDDSALPEYDYTEVNGSQPGASIIGAAIGFILLQLRLARAVRRRDEPVMLFFGATTYLLPILTARLAGKTVLVQPRGDVPLALQQIWAERIGPLAWGPATALRALERACYWTATHIVTYTPAMAEELDVDGENCYPHAARFVDTERFAVETPYDDRDRVVGFFGRLDPEKNIGRLVGAIKHLPDDITFRFIGDGECRELVGRELATEIENGQVEVCGWVEHDQLTPVVNDLRLIVLPATPTEGLPTTVLEAMACGTPALATPVSGIPTVVRDGETGWHLTDTTPAALANRIETLVDRHPTAVSEAARAEIEAAYTFEAAVNRYRTLLHRVDPAPNHRIPPTTWSDSGSWVGSLEGE